MSLPFLRESLVRSKVIGDKKAEAILNSMLRENKSIEEIEAYFNVTTSKPSLMEDKKLAIAYDLINESYVKLAPIEKQLISLVESNRKQRVYTQIKLVESMIGDLRDPKEKLYATECLTVLKHDITKRSLFEASERVLDLKKTVISLFEAKDEAYGGFVNIKLGSLNYIKNINLAILSDEVNSPETIYVTFEVPFYPLGSDFSSVKASLQSLDSQFGRIGRTVLNKTIHQTGKAGKIFTGEGIWDAGVRVNAVKPGQVALGSAELALHLVPGSVKSTKQLAIEVKALMKDLDVVLPTLFKELDKKAQKAYMKGGDEEGSADLKGLKKQMRKRNGDDRAVADKEDNFGGAF